MVLIAEQDLFNRIESILEKRNADIRVNRHPFNTMLIGIPKRKAFVHGISFEISCNKQQTACDISGDLHIEQRLEKIASSDLEKSGCKNIGIHN